jgi:hypothetical protein
MMRTTTSPTLTPSNYNEQRKAHNLPCESASTTSLPTYDKPKHGQGANKWMTRTTKGWTNTWRKSDECCPTTSLLPLRHPQGGGERVTNLRSAHAMQSQFVHVHIFVKTIITFVIHIVMKGESPPSIMCASTTNDIYYELKHDNDITNMKMLEMRKPTSPNKLYIKLRPTFMSTREDREASTTKRKLQLPPPLRHLRQVLSRHLRLWTYVIFAYFPRVYLHRHHQVQGDHLQARVTLPSSEAPQGRWPRMGNSLWSWRRAKRCDIIWSSYKTTTRRSSKGHPL